MASVDGATATLSLTTYAPSLMYHNTFQNKYPTISSRAKSYVRSRARAQMNSTVKIYERNEGTLNESTGLITSTFGVLMYSGMARIWTTSGAFISVGEAMIATDTVYCSIPFDVPAPKLDNLVEVIDCPDDNDISDRVWRIVGTDAGGLLRATRRLQITAWDSNRYWE